MNAAASPREMTRSPAGAGRVGAAGGTRSAGHELMTVEAGRGSSLYQFLNVCVFLKGDDHDEKNKKC